MLLLRKVLQVGAVLGPPLCLLHLAQPAQRADAHGDAEQIGLDRIGRQLGVGRYPSRELYDIETAIRSVGGHAAASQNQPGVLARVERAVVRRRKRRPECVQKTDQAVEVLWIGVRDDVEVHRRSHVAVCSYGDATDDDELDFLIVKRMQQGAKVEFGQRSRAAPLTALIWRESS